MSEDWPTQTAAGDGVTGDHCNADTAWGHGGADQELDCAAQCHIGAGLTRGHGGAGQGQGRGEAGRGRGCGEGGQGWYRGGAGRARGGEGRGQGPVKAPSGSS